MVRKTKQAPQPRRGDSEQASDPGMQQSGTHGQWQDDALKGITRQHPQRGIPQVDSLEPPEAPAKE